LELGIGTIVVLIDASKDEREVCRRDLKSVLLLLQAQSSRIMLRAIVLVDPCDVSMAVDA